MSNIGRKTSLNETKRDKFVRLAENRMDKALKQIELIGNLANKSNYDYSSSDSEKIVRALKNAVSNLEKEFATSNRNNKKFRL